MAESNQISRKRMRFSSSPASQIITRSNSKKQRNLSGRMAPTVAHNTGNEFRGPQKSRSLSGKIESKVILTYPRVTIKDLRLRRVFSQKSISRVWESNGKGENRTKQQAEDNPCDSYDLNIAKEGIKINAGGFGNVEAEDFLKTTPPDPDLFITEPISAVNEEERITEGINVPSVKKSDTNFYSKSVLHPCSRAKIFKNPGSFSYKRLLPYLMQAANDGTASGQFSKPEKSSSQNPPDIISSSNKETLETKNTGIEVPEEVGELMTAKCQLPETTQQVLQSVDKAFNKQTAGSLSGDTSPLKRVILSSPNKKPVLSRRKLFKAPGSLNYRRMLPYLRDIQQDTPCMSETFNQPDHQKNTEENTPSTVLVSEMVKSNVAKESDTCSNENNETLLCEQEAQVKHVIPDTEKNLGTPHNVFASEITLASPLVYSRSSSEVVEENINNAELLSPSEVIATPTSISPTKGILKRTIGGCRGICSCLNCSSFRLNAERAFEFSRNQLQDTEVMVLNLVGEISRLRDTLDKYDHNESYKIQAGEAGKIASEAAELAKSRLIQMNNDLQIHCRIPNEQRARVKFAHYIHEKTVLKATEPNKLIE